MAGRILRGGRIVGKTAILAAPAGTFDPAVLPLAALKAHGGATSGGAAGISVDAAIAAAGGAGTSGSATAHIPFDISAAGGATTIGAAGAIKQGPYWTQRGAAMVLASPAAGDAFGCCVAVSGNGNVLAVGAYGRDDAASNAGAVYIYDRSGMAWTLRGSAILAADAEANDNFGYSVALNDDGTILAVGARTWDGAQPNSGGVYLFDWSGSAWTQRGSVLDVSGAYGFSNLNFGSSVAISSDGEILVVGADGYGPSGTGTWGGVYTFDRSGSSWTQRGSALTPADAASGDQFARVAISSNGDILAVGAFTWEGGNSNQGGVYTFDRSGSSWTQRGSVLEAPDAAASDFFGYTTGLSGDGTKLFVGARLWEGGVNGQGCAYVFTYSGSAWSQYGDVLTASDAADTDGFGSVATNALANILVVGADLRDADFSDQGGVYTFEWTPPPSGSGIVAIYPAVSGVGEFNNSLGVIGTGAVTIYPAVAGSGTFPTIYGSGTATISPTVSGAARIDVAWTAAVSSAPSTGQAAMHAYEISWSTAVSSAPSEVEAEAWAGTLEMPSIGIGYAAQGAERTAVAAITITCEIGGIAYPAQYLTIRKRLAAGDGTASYGTETADVAIPYTRAVFSALLAASRAGESIILSARYVLDSGEAYVRPLGDFALTAIKRSANGATVIASGERFPVYAVSDDPVLLAGSCYETARSVRCAVDHQVYPGQTVQGMAAAFTCDAVTITLDAPQASAIMEVFARG